MSKTTSFGYDLNGNTVIKTLGNGLLEERTHDARNRVSSLNNQNSGGSDLAGYVYAYDLEGNVRQVTESYAAGSLALAGRTITNSYDGVYRLVTEQIDTAGSGTVTTLYIYDKANNRVSEYVGGAPGGTTYLIGNGNNGAGANQIKSITYPSGGTIAFTYDLNGNRVKGVVGSNTDLYSYDYENRLVSLNYQTGSSGIGTYTYGYDYRTRRVTRAEPSAAITKITFMGGVSVEEYTSSASSPAVEYIRGHDYGGGVGGLEYCERSGQPAYNFYNSRGDVVSQTNAAAAVTFEAGYDAFGAILVQEGATPDRQKANTKEQDPTGLINDGFRYRDPATGTFIARDPAGFIDGPNLYTYVHQNPWTHFDPEGLEDNDKKHDPPPPPPKNLLQRIGQTIEHALTGKFGSPDATAKTTQVQSASTVQVYSPGRKLENSSVYLDKDGGTHTYAPRGSSLHGDDSIQNAEYAGTHTLSSNVILFDKGNPVTNREGFLRSVTVLRTGTGAPLNAETVPYMALRPDQLNGARRGDMVTVTSQGLNSQNRAIGPAYRMDIPYADARGTSALKFPGYEMSTAAVKGLHIPTALNQYGHTVSTGRQHIDIQTHPGTATLNSKTGKPYYPGPNP